MATKEYFPGIGKIKFEGKESMNPMAFRYYDAEKAVMGKKMKDWLKFAMAWWHTLCAEGGDQFGCGTKQFPCRQGNRLRNVKKLEIHHDLVAPVGDVVDNWPPAGKKQLQPYLEKSDLSIRDN